MRAVTSVREIPRAQWQAFFDQFSRTHRGRVTALDTTSPALDDRQEVAARPLRSITPFVHNDKVDHIDIRFQDEINAGAPFRIHLPIAVRVDETTTGIARGLEIVDARDCTTRLRFRAPPMADTRDPGHQGA